MEAMDNELKSNALGMGSKGQYELRNLHDAGA